MTWLNHILAECQVNTASLVHEGLEFVGWLFLLALLLWVETEFDTVYLYYRSIWGYYYLLIRLIFGFCCIITHRFSYVYSRMRLV